MKKKLLLISSLILLGSVAYAELQDDTGDNPNDDPGKTVVIEESGSQVEDMLDDVEIDIPEKEKKWRFVSKLDLLQRQQNRITDYGKEEKLPVNPWEDGDVYGFTNSITYKFNKNLSLEYANNYEYWDDNQSAFYNRPMTGVQANSAYEKKDYLSSRQNTVTATYEFDRIKLFGKNVSNRVYGGYKHWYMQSFDRFNTNDTDPELGGRNKYVWGNRTQHRIFAGTRTSTRLTPKLNFVLTTQYRYIKQRDYIPSGTRNTNARGDWGYHHREYITPTFTYKFTEDTSFMFRNAIQARQYITNGDRNRGYWEPTYTLEHQIPLVNGYVLTLPLTWWGEFHIWDTNWKNSSGTWSDVAEFNLLPEVKKTYRINKDTRIAAYVSVGYVYGYNANASYTKPAYKGWQGNAGFTFTYDF